MTLNAWWAENRLPISSFAGFSYLRFFWWQVFEIYRLYYRLQQFEPNTSMHVDSEKVQN